MLDHVNAGRALAAALAPALVALALAGCAGGDDDADATATGAPTPIEPTAAGSTPSTPDDGTTEASATQTPSESATATSEAVPSAEPTPASTASEAESASPLDIDRSEAGRYRAAIAARDAGDLDAAIKGLAAVEAAGGPLAGAAGLRLAQTLVLADRHAEAVDAFADALAEPDFPQALTHVARVEHARALQHLGRDAEALEVLNAAVGDPGASEADVTNSRWLRAVLLRDLGDPAWVDDALAIVATSPGAWQAAAALDALDSASVSVATGSAAYVRYLNWDNAAAIELYEEIAAAPATSTDAGTAWFYLGALAERSLANLDAIEAYEQSLLHDPTGWVADDARWWLAVLLEGEDRTEEAVVQYDALVAAFPGSAFAPEAELRAALALARAGEETRAAARLRRVISHDDRGLAASAARWLDVLGLSSVADPGPSEIDPRSLPALLATVGDGALPPGAASEWSPPAAEWDEVEPWLEARFGPRPAGAGVLDEHDYDVAIALLDAGERSVARGVLGSLLGRYLRQPHAMADLAHAAADEGMHDLAMIAALRLLGRLGPDERDAAPLALELLAYPAPFEADVLSSAEIEELPPLLLLALVRQESAFDPAAGSTAGALGLTQVIPQTGAQIAASLGVEWDVQSLFDPATSLRFGAHYLAAQLEGFDGDLLAALAAYNAGPGNAARWYDQQWLDGPDGYVDAVDFIETRRYLETVLENYAMYRHLYGGAPRPSLG